MLSIIGTRPEAIKMAPVIRAIAERGHAIEGKLVVTAQHREMLDEVLGLFEIRPAYDLNVMLHDQTPTQVAAAVASKLEPILERERPDWLLVQGDTTTTMAASLAGFYSSVRVGHVEAGLRTDDRRQPFPEEVNRRITSILADIHFAPTETARENLLREGVEADRIHVTGNPVIDALQWVSRLPPDESLQSGILPEDPTVRVVLLTAHRRENFGEGLAGICEAVRRLCLRYAPRLRVLYPVHPNPNVEGPVRRLLGDVPEVRLLPPVPYNALVQIMERSYLVMTDSGGIQEEAPGLGKPVLVLRQRTERPEAVLAGAARLVGTDADEIVAAAVELWEDDLVYQRMARAVNPFGDGRAAERIVDALLREPTAPASF